MKKMKRLITAASFLVASFNLTAQDLHFSQFFNTPVALNPALTGFIKQDFRMNAIYRNQWKQANAQFATTAFAADGNIRPAKLNGDMIGAGIFLFNDQMGNQTVTNNSIYLSGSYIKTLDAQKRHKVSLGAQLGLVQKSIDYNNLYFDQQIIDYKVDMSAASGESGFENKFSYLNLNVGAFYRFKVSGGTDVHLGFSAFNLLKPKENFVQQALETDVNQLRNRGIINLGLRQRLLNNLWIRPEILIMLQSKASDKNLGGMLEYALTGNPDLLLLQAGAWYRTRDAFILYGGVKYHNILVGISYDMTNSSLVEIRDTPEVSDKAKIGAFEITLTYLGFFKRALPYEHTVPCRFF